METENSARVFNHFLHSTFSKHSINGFTTEMQKAITRMTEIGIELPKDILAYLLLFKFPPILENLKQQIIHLEKNLTVDVVFNHLTQYNNERRAQIKFIKTSANVSLVKTKAKHNKDKCKIKMRCKEGYHNPNPPSQVVLFPLTS